MVMHHSYSKSLKTCIDSKEVICKENVFDVLEDLHYIKTIGGERVVSLVA